MCGLAGMFSYGDKLNEKDIKNVMSALLIESMERGTHATGISYVDSGKVKISKAAKPACNFKFDIPKGVRAVQGHVRFTTQGSEKNNQNNHPFVGKAGKNYFSLSHNGIIYNDGYLKRQQELPCTNIETDSYVAVQLLEKEKKLNIESIKNMVELLEGSFCFSIFDSTNNLFLVKGSNPLAVIHNKDLQAYFYASTEEILWGGKVRSNLFQRFKKTLIKSPGDIEIIEIDEGDIIQIKPDGTLKHGKFKINQKYDFWPYRFHSPYSSLCEDRRFENLPNSEYLEDLKSIARLYGYDDEFVEILLSEGFSTDEIEEAIYNGDFPEQEGMHSLPLCQ